MVAHRHIYLSIYFLTYTCARARARAQIYMFSLAYLCNGIPVFVGYSMSKTSLLKNTGATF